MKPVIIAKQFDCQWYTHHGIKELLDDPIVVAIASSKDFSDTLDWAYAIEDYCDDRYGYRDTWGDTATIGIEYIPEGTDFTVENIDGWETIIIKE